MPHQCVRCNALYEDTSQHILKGCPCGCKVFFFVKKSALEKSRKVLTELSVQEKEKIEQDIYEILGEETASESPVILDLETINILGEGKFEIDLAHLFNPKMPVVYKLEEGKYIIDIGETFIRNLDGNNKAVRNK